MTVLIACDDDARVERIRSTVMTRIDDPDDVVVVRSAEECRRRARSLPATLVIASPPLPGGAVSVLLAELAGPPVGARTMAVLEWEEEPRGVAIRSTEPLGRLVDRALNPGEAGGPDMEEIRTLVSRIRHDINNPLTSALAETQLLLMDHPEGEIGESLEQVQKALRRIRDLVAELNAIPRPS